VRSGTWAGSRDERGVREASMQDNNSNGYFIISFDDNGYRTHFEATDLGAEEQIRIVPDPPYIAMRKSDPNRGQLAGPTRAVVNVLDGGEHNKVKSRLMAIGLRRRSRYCARIPTCMRCSSNIRALKTRTSFPNSRLTSGSATFPAFAGRAHRYRAID
jgi:hypothetical protein